MTARPLTGPGLRAGYRLAVLAAAMLAIWMGVSPASAHPVSGTFSVTAETAAATQLPTIPQTSPSATPTPTQPARMPGSLKLVIGAVAIIFGVTVARRASRRGNASRP